MKKGRPTKYCDTLPAMVDDYLAEKETPTITPNGKTIYGLPMISGFCQYIGIHVDTANEWEKKYPKFSEALDKIRHKQHEKLVEYGLSKEFESGIAKLILARNHGYVDQTEQKNVTMSYAEWCEQQKLK